MGSGILALPLLLLLSGQVSSREGRVTPPLDHHPTRATLTTTDLPWSVLGLSYWVRAKVPPSPADGVGPGLEDSEGPSYPQTGAGGRGQQRSAQGRSNEVRAKVPRSPFDGVGPDTEGSGESEPPVVRAVNQAVVRASRRATEAPPFNVKPGQGSVVEASEKGVSVSKTESSVSGETGGDYEETDIYKESSFSNRTIQSSGSHASNESFQFNSSDTFNETFTSFNESFWNESFTSDFNQSTPKSDGDDWAQHKASTLVSDTKLRQSTVEPDINTKQNVGTEANKWTEAVTEATVRSTLTQKTDGSITRNDISTTKSKETETKIKFEPTDKSITEGLTLQSEKPTDVLFTEKWRTDNKASTTNNPIPVSKESKGFTSEPVTKVDGEDSTLNKLPGTRGAITQNYEDLTKTDDLEKSSQTWSQIHVQSTKSSLGDKSHAPTVDPMGKTTAEPLSPAMDWLGITTGTKLPAEVTRKDTAASVDGAFTQGQEEGNTEKLSTKSSDVELQGDKTMKNNVEGTAAPVTLGANDVRLKEYSVSYLAAKQTMSGKSVTEVEGRNTVTEASFKLSETSLPEKKSLVTNLLSKSTEKGLSDTTEYAKSPEGKVSFPVTVVDGITKIRRAATNPDLSKEIEPTIVSEIYTDGPEGKASMPVYQTPLNQEKMPTDDYTKDSVTQKYTHDYTKVLAVSDDNNVSPVKEHMTRETNTKIPFATKAQFTDSNSKVPKLAISTEKESNNKQVTKAAVSGTRTEKSVTEEVIIKTSVMIPNTEGQITSKDLVDADTPEPKELATDAETNIPITKQPELMERKATTGVKAKESEAPVPTEAISVTNIVSRKESSEFHTADKLFTMPNIQSSKEPVSKDDTKETVSNKKSTEGYMKASFSDLFTEIVKTEQSPMKENTHQPVTEHSIALSDTEAKETATPFLSPGELRHSLSDQSVAAAHVTIAVETGTRAPVTKKTENKGTNVPVTKRLVTSVEVGKDFTKDVIIIGQTTEANDKESVTRSDTKALSTDTQLTENMETNVPVTKKLVTSVDVGKDITKDVIIIGQTTEANDKESITRSDTKALLTDTQLTENMETNVPVTKGLATSVDVGKDFTKDVIIIGQTTEANDKESVTRSDTKALLTDTHLTEVVTKVPSASERATTESKNILTEDQMTKEMKTEAIVTEPYQKASFSEGPDEMRQKTESSITQTDPITKVTNPQITGINSEVPETKPPVTIAEELATKVTQSNTDAKVSAREAWGSTPEVPPADHLSTGMPLTEKPVSLANTVAVVSDLPATNRKSDVPVTEHSLAGHSTNIPSKRTGPVTDAEQFTGSPLSTDAIKDRTIFLNPTASTGKQDRTEASEVLTVKPTGMPDSSEPSPGMAKDETLEEISTRAESTDQVEMITGKPNTNTPSPEISSIPIVSDSLPVETTNAAEKTTNVSPTLADASEKLITAPMPGVTEMVTKDQPTQGGTNPVTEDNLQDLLDSTVNKGKDSSTEFPAATKIVPEEKTELVSAMEATFRNTDSPFQRTTLSISREITNERHSISTLGLSGKTDQPFTTVENNFSSKINLGSVTTSIIKEKLTSEPRDLPTDKPTRTAPAIQTSAGQETPSEFVMQTTVGSNIEWSTDEQERATSAPPFSERVEAQSTSEMLKTVKSGTLSVLKTDVTADPSSVPERTSMGQTLDPTTTPPITTPPTTALEPELVTEDGLTDPQMTAAPSTSIRTTTTPEPSTTPPNTIPPTRTIEPTTTPAPSITPPTTLSKTTSEETRKPEPEMTSRDWLTDPPLSTPSTATQPTTTPEPRTQPPTTMPPTGTVEPTTKPGPSTTAPTTTSLTTPEPTTTPEPEQTTEDWVTNPQITTATTTPTQTTTPEPTTIPPTGTQESTKTPGPSAQLPTTMQPTASVEPTTTPGQSRTPPTTVIPTTMPELTTKQEPEQTTDDWVTDPQITKAPTTSTQTTTPEPTTILLTGTVEPTTTPGPSTTSPTTAIPTTMPELTTRQEPEQTTDDWLTDPAITTAPTRATKTTPEPSTQPPTTILPTGTVEPTTTPEPSTSSTTTAIPTTTPEPEQTTGDWLTDPTTPPTTTQMTTTPEATSTPPTTTPEQSTTPPTSPTTTPEPELTSEDLLTDPITTTPEPSATPRTTSLTTTPETITMLPTTTPTAITPTTTTPEPELTTEDWLTDPPITTAPPTTSQTTTTPETSTQPPTTIPPTGTLEPTTIPDPTTRPPTTTPSVPTPDPTTEDWVTDPAVTSTPSTTTQTTSTPEPSTTPPTTIPGTSTPPPETTSPITTPEQTTTPPNTVFTSTPPITTPETTTTPPTTTQETHTIPPSTIPTTTTELSTTSPTTKQPSTTQEPELTTEDWLTDPPISTSRLTTTQPTTTPEPSTQPPTTTPPTATQMTTAPEATTTPPTTTPEQSTTTPTSPTTTAPEPEVTSEDWLTDPPISTIPSTTTESTPVPTTQSSTTTPVTTTPFSTVFTSTTPTTRPEPTTTPHTTTPQTSTPELTTIPPTTSTPRTTAEATTPPPTTTSPTSTPEPTTTVLTTTPPTTTQPTTSPKPTTTPPTTTQEPTTIPPASTSPSTIRTTTASPSSMLPETTTASTTTFPTTTSKTTTLPSTVLTTTPPETTTPTTTTPTSMTPEPTTRPTTTSIPTTTPSTTSQITMSPTETSPETTTPTPTSSTTQPKTSQLPTPTPYSSTSLTTMPPPSAPPSTTLKSITPTALKGSTTKMEDWTTTNREISTFPTRRGTHPKETANIQTLPYTTGSRATFFIPFTYQGKTTPLLTGSKQLPSVHPTLINPTVQTTMKTDTQNPISPIFPQMERRPTRNPLSFSLPSNDGTPRPSFINRFYTSTNREENSFSTYYNNYYEGSDSAGKVPPSDYDECAAVRVVLQQIILLMGDLISSERRALEKNLPSVCNFTLDEFPIPWRANGPDNNLNPQQGEQDPSGFPPVNVGQHQTEVNLPTSHSIPEPSTHGPNYGKDSPYGHMGDNLDEVESDLAIRENGPDYHGELGQRPDYQDPIASPDVPDINGDAATDLYQFGGPEHQAAQAEAQEELDNIDRNVENIFNNIQSSVPRIPDGNPLNVDPDVGHIDSNNPSQDHFNPSLESLNAPLGNANHYAESQDDSHQSEYSDEYGSFFDSSEHHGSPEDISNQADESAEQSNQEHSDHSDSQYSNEHRSAYHYNTHQEHSSSTGNNAGVAANAQSNAPMTTNFNNSSIHNHSSATSVNTDPQRSPTQEETPVPKSGKDEQAGQSGSLPWKPNYHAIQLAHTMAHGKKPLLSDLFHHKLHYLRAGLSDGRNDAYYHKQHQLLAGLNKDIFHPDKNIKSNGKSATNTGSLVSPLFNSAGTQQNSGFGQQGSISQSYPQGWNFDTNIHGVPARNSHRSQFSSSFSSREYSSSENSYNYQAQARQGQRAHSKSSKTRQQNNDQNSFSSSYQQSGKNKGKSWPGATKHRNSRVTFSWPRNRKTPGRRRHHWDTPTAYGMGFPLPRTDIFDESFPNMRNPNPFSSTKDTAYQKQPASMEFSSAEVYRRVRVRPRLYPRDQDRGMGSDWFEYPSHRRYNPGLSRTNAHGQEQSYHSPGGSMNSDSFNDFWTGL